MSTTHSATENRKNDGINFKPSKMPSEIAVTGTKKNSQIHQDSAAECRTHNRIFHIGCLRTCINENAAGQRETNAELYRRTSVRKIVKSGQIGGQEVFAHKEKP